MYLDQYIYGPKISLVPDLSVHLFLIVFWPRRIYFFGWACNVIVLGLSIWTNIFRENMKKCKGVMKVRPKGIKVQRRVGVNEC